ncbi:MULTISPECIES: type 1 glutamine amidotransferase domain-containing protein [Mameliella]|uniref:Glutamine amidotransferase n=1 Tax=Mameliella alba TaxID=561184 RepID=A0A0B3RFZ1_9RHOB|nr:MULTISPECIES: type 1 glutamine amidotransferase domain-containing protein [Mameliella]KHQ50135.1 Glutamine amidotransferase [Mameliella alba]
MSLIGKNVALLIEDDYQEMEAWYPYMRLIEEGAKVTVVGPGHKSTFQSKLGYEMEADVSIDQVKAADFDAVVVPGGFAPDHMRLCRPMIDLVRDVHARGKLAAAICHGGWILSSAGIVKGRKVTGYLPIKDDVEAAGGTWVDEEVVQDGNVITSRTPPDLPAFARAIVQYLGAEANQRKSA